MCSRRLQLVKGFKPDVPSNVLASNLQLIFYDRQFQQMDGLDGMSDFANRI